MNTCTYSYFHSCIECVVEGQHTSAQHLMDTDQWQLASCRHCGEKKSLTVINHCAIVRFLLYFSSYICLDLLVWLFRPSWWHPRCLEGAIGRVEPASLYPPRTSPNCPFLLSCSLSMLRLGDSMKNRRLWRPRPQQLVPLLCLDYPPPLCTWSRW